MAVLCPSAVGLNKIVDVQLLPIASSAGQSLLCANWCSFGPERLVAVIGNATLPVLRIVTVWALVVPFRFTLPNATEFGDTEYSGLHARARHFSCA